MKIGFIGPGKVGVNLGRYFIHKGINLTGFYGETEKNAKEAANITKSKFYNNIGDIIKESDILFITTPDDIISIIDTKLSMFNLKDKSVCHTSGSIPSTVLFNAKQSGALIYSIHPICAFSKKDMNLKDLETIYFSIEGDISLDNNMNLEEVSKMSYKDIYPIINLLDKVGNKYFIRSKETSYIYHLANVFVSNLTLSLLAKGTNYLKQLGLSENDALNAIKPLIYGNINNIFEKGFINSLTGPVVRGDINTVKKHLCVLKNEDTELYKKLSLNLLKLVALKNEKYESDENALKDLLINSKKYLEIYKLLGGME